MTRALPLLLLFITFLFINTEVWQVALNLDAGVLWLTVMLFAADGGGVPAGPAARGARPRRRRRRPTGSLAACRGTPLEASAAEVVDDRDEADPRHTPRSAGFEKWNLVLVLLVSQSVQVLLLALAVLRVLPGLRRVIMTSPR